MGRLRGSISQKEAVRRALDAGIEWPDEIVAYVLREFDISIGKGAVSTLKSQLRSEQRQTSSVLPTTPEQPEPEEEPERLIDSLERVSMTTPTRPPLSAPQEAPPTVRNHEPGSTTAVALRHLRAALALLDPEEAKQLIDVLSE